MGPFTFSPLALKALAAMTRRELGLPPDHTNPWTPLHKGAWTLPPHWQRVYDTCDAASANPAQVICPIHVK